MHGHIQLNTGCPLPQQASDVLNATDNFLCTSKPGHPTGPDRGASERDYVAMRGSELQHVVIPTRN